MNRIVIPPRTEWPSGWSVQLDTYLDSIDGRPFDWQALNCAFFAADAVLAVTGLDLVADFRGKRISDMAGARRAILRSGFASLDALAADRLPEMPVATARRADIAAVMSDTGPVLAVVDGRELIAMTLTGKGVLPLTQAFRAFRVG